MHRLAKYKKQLVRVLALEMFSHYCKKGRLSHDAQESYFESFYENENDYINELSRILIVVFDGQRESVLRNIQNSSSASKKSLSDMWLFNMFYWNEILSDSLKEFFRKLLIQEGKSSMIRISQNYPLVGELSFEVTNPRIVDFVNTYPISLAFEINAFTENELRKELLTGLMSGDSMKEIEERVQSVFKFAIEYRSERIARTESIRAMNAAAEMSYVQSGVVVAKEWSSAMDARSCEFCDSLNGKVIPMQEPFLRLGEVLEVNKRTIHIDYETIMHPPLHPNCRCCLLPVVMDF